MKTVAIIVFLSLICVANGKILHYTHTILVKEFGTYLHRPLDVLQKFETIEKSMYLKFIMRILNQGFYIPARIFGREFL